MSTSSTTDQSLAIIVLMTIIALVSAQAGVPAVAPTNGGAAAPPAPAAPITSTTVAPPTTTLPPVTTTPVPVPQPTPGPIPEPEQWSGTVAQGNSTCIKVLSDIKIIIQYPNGTSNVSSSPLTAGFVIPKTATVDELQSHCSGGLKNESTEILVITFNNMYNTSANLTVSFKRDSDNKVSVDELDLSFNVTKNLLPQLYSDSTEYGHLLSASVKNQSLFSVANQHSYKCDDNAVKLDGISIGDNQPLINITIEFSHFQFEAFMNHSSNTNVVEFDTAIDCKSNEISDVVPIAVGAALAGLVVIVLIAYFIGRRRSRRLAYQSV
ncbi:lysosome-associated membrane glycoprotein 2-like [Oppia nitens]|uniref:lysosome-associated membrane glycoprotein 2-like n=1 Tax=Oppia nitens TaxID=1686743 RepID=UPI0023DCC70E|nr:lysosome-associated membrane glycoprotein 2-like [Oppia nitens]